MMLQKQTALVLGLLVLVGCTTPLERRQASGEFDYLEQPTPSVLVVPENLEAIKVNPEYVIPPLGSEANAELVGPRLDIRPPLQILPLAPGTRLQDGSDRITVVIETNDGDVPLDQEIKDTLMAFLNAQGIGVATDLYGTVITDWIEDEEVIGRAWFREQVYKIRQRYRFDVGLKEHGRTGSLTIALVNHEEGKGNFDDDIVLTDADRRRYAIDMLNRALIYLNEQRVSQIEARLAANRQGIGAELGFDSDNNRAIVTEAGFEQVWQRLDEVLPLLGFEVRDRDLTLATYFVDFEPEFGLWDRLWGGNRALPLEKGSYRVKLEGDKQRSAITLLDDEAKPLSEELVEASFERMAEVLGEQR